MGKKGGREAVKPPGRQLQTIMEEAAGSFSTINPVCLVARVKAQEAAAALIKIPGNYGHYPPEACSFRVAGGVGTPRLRPLTLSLLPGASRPVVIQDLRLYGPRPESDIILHPGLWSSAE